MYFYIRLCIFQSYFLLLDVVVISSLIIFTILLNRFNSLRTIFLAFKIDWKFLSFVFLFKHSLIVSSSFEIYYINCS